MPNGAERCEASPPNKGQDLSPLQNLRCALVLLWLLMTRFVTASASEAVSSAIVGDCVDLAKGGRGLAMTDLDVTRCRVVPRAMGYSR